MFNLFRKIKRTESSHISNLIAVAKADGQFLEIEKDLLNAVAVRNKIPLKEIETIQKNPANIDFEAPTDSRTKFHQLYDLIHMMIVDNIIHAEELKLCHQFVSKFGYPPAGATELIELISANIKNGQAHDETMQRVRFALKFN
jgi:uncharacterized tellurite resistance protein B-like protein